MHMHACIMISPYLLIKIMIASVILHAADNPRIMGVRKFPLEGYELNHRKFTERILDAVHTIGYMYSKQSVTHIAATLLH